MLANFFNNTVVVRRLRRTSGTKRQYYATATTDCNIQNEDPKVNNPLEGVAEKQYIAFFDIDADIQEGDILTDANSQKQYKVISTERIAESLGLAVDYLEVKMQFYTS